MSGKVFKPLPHLIARREGVTRARVTQVIMLVRLASDIQESILGLARHPDPP